MIIRVLSLQATKDDFKAMANIVLMAVAELKSDVEFDTVGCGCRDCETRRERQKKMLAQAIDLQDCFQQAADIADAFEPPQE